MFLCSRRRTARLRYAAAVLATMAVVLLGSAPASGATTASPTPTPTGGSEVTVVPDVRYGRGESLVLDVYRATDAVAYPVVMLIHGGGWSDGDKDKFDDESRALARANFVVFDLNYTLVPEDGAAYPRQVNEVHTALTWVLSHAEEYGGDPSRLGVLGGSAGGYLASILAFQANTAEDQPVRALASLSGPVDLPSIVDGLRVATTAPDGTCTPVDCDVIEGATNSLRTLLGCDPVACSPDLVTEASPSTYVSSYSPPSFFANGTEERVLPEQSALVAELLRAEDVAVEAEVVEGDFHSVQLLPAVGADLLDFLVTNLAPLPETTPPTTSTASSEAPATAAPDNGSPRRLRWIVVGAALLLLVGAFAVRRLTGSDRQS